MEAGLALVSQFSLDKDEYSREMCYVNGNLVIGFAAHIIKVYQGETGSVLYKWKWCHSTPRLMQFEAEGKEYLLEACTTCCEIRGYEFPMSSCSNKTFFEHIFPSVMCKGSDGTILVFDRNNVIKHLRFSGEQFHLVDTFSFELEHVNKMCYCEKYGIVVVLHTDRKSLTGVMLATGQVAWKKADIKFGSTVLDSFKDVLTIPDGRVCIIDLWSLFVLDPKDGTFMYKLFDIKGSGWIWKFATGNSGFHQRFVIENGELREKQLSVYNLLPERCLPLRSITSDETNSKTNENS